jgi:hypothetical protein
VAFELQFSDLHDTILSILRVQALTRGGETEQSNFGFHGIMRFDDPIGLKFDAGGLNPESRALREVGRPTVFSNFC